MYGNPTYQPTETIGGRGQSYSLGELKRSFSVTISKLLLLLLLLFCISCQSMVHQWFPVEESPLISNNPNEYSLYFKAQVMFLNLSFVNGEKTETSGSSYIFSMTCTTQKKIPCCQLPAAGTSYHLLCCYSVKLSCRLWIFASIGRVPSCTADDAGLSDKIIFCQLTHISQALMLWYMGKQCKPSCRSDAAIGVSTVYNRIFH